MKNKRSILKAISMALVIALTLSNGIIVSNISYASYNGDSEDPEQLEDPENPEDLELFEELEEVDEEEELRALLLEHEIYGTATTSGECGAQGDNLIWTFYEETKTLIISGEGAMMDYGSRPSFANLNFTTLVIEEGVTTIGRSCFNNSRQIEGELVNLTSGTNVYSNRSRLKELTVPGKLKDGTINYSMFSGMS